LRTLRVPIRDGCSPESGRHGRRRSSPRGPRHWRRRGTPMSAPQRTRFLISRRRSLLEHGRRLHRVRRRSTCGACASPPGLRQGSRQCVGSACSPPRLDTRTMSQRRSPSAHSSPTVVVGGGRVLRFVNVAVLRDMGGARHRPSRNVLVVAAHHPQRQTLRSCNAGDIFLKTASASSADTLHKCRWPSTCQSILSASARRIPHD
jgi:hypothetical protein